MASELISRNIETGDGGNSDSTRPMISADGNIVAFASGATDLVPNYTGGAAYWVFNRTSQSYTAVVDLPNANHFDVTLSGNGDVFAYGTLNNFAFDHVFTKTISTGTIEQVDLGVGAASANGVSWDPGISDDGRYVTFSSQATNLVNGDTNAASDVFVRDRANQTTELISQGIGGAVANGTSALSAISADGRYVAFVSDASNLVPGDTNNSSDVFVLDRQTGEMDRVSVLTGGTEVSASDYGGISISADGRYVTFDNASNAFDAVFFGNNHRDVFVHDRVNDTTQSISRTANGGSAPADSQGGTISADGSAVLFYSRSQLDFNFTDSGNFIDYLFWRDLSTNQLLRVGAGIGTDQNAISADGLTIAREVSQFHRQIDVLEIGELNQPPTDISLSGDTVVENSAHGTVIGTLSATDPDAGDTVTFSLVFDAGGRVTLDGANLVVAGPINYEASTSFTVTVQATDADGASYEENLTINVTDVFDPPADFEALIGGGFGTWNMGAKTPVFVTYSFPTAMPAEYGQDPFQLVFPDMAATFQPLSAAEQNIARQAFQLWDNAAGIRFLEVPDGQGDIRLSKYNFSTDPFFSGNLGFTAGTGRTIGSLSTSESPNSGEILLDYAGTSLYVIAHEIGHAIGLKHPQDGSPTLNPALDNGANTVMSLNQSGFANALGTLDAQVAPFLYGSTDGGQLVGFDWNSTQFELTQAAGSGNDVLHGVSVADTLTAGAGQDTVAGWSGNDRIFGGAGQDSLFGGDGNDTLVGNDDIFESVQDELFGEAGDDTIYAEVSDSILGGAGRDVVLVVNANPFSINMGATGIEFVISDFGNDTINASTQTVGVEVYTDGGNDVITGSPFNDFIFAGSADDTVTAGDGDDVIVADVGTDSVSGGNGNDSIYADNSDTVDGGAGFDALYITDGAAAAGLTVDVAATGLEFVIDFTVAGGNDTINGAASSADLDVYAQGGTDAVTGGSGADFLWGGSGDDTITGNGGDDTLVGETGSDTLTGGAGIDNLFGNSGNGGDSVRDTFVFTAGWGTDFVFDFDNGTDKFDVRAVGGGLDDFGDFTITNTPQGHAYVAFGANLIAVAGAAGQIDTGDFIFV